MKEFPDLFKPAQWGDFAKVQFFEGFVPNEKLIANVNIIPYVEQWVVVIKTINGQYEIPGGTLEPDEPYQQTICRELLEEAGSQLKPGTGFTPIGYWQCQSLLDVPYRQHLPFPISYRLVGYADVEIISIPMNPPDGEQIRAVEVIPLEDAVKKFFGSKRPDIGDLYRFSTQIRLRSI